MAGAEKAGSTMLFTVKISKATPSLVKITLELMTGGPAGDQLPLEDHKVSPAAPLQKAGAAGTELASMTRAANKVPLMRWGALFI